MSRHLPFLITCLALVSTAVWSYPTSLNVIPTADILEPYECRMEFENDGYSKLFEADSETYWLFQTGLTPRLEVGVDMYSLEQNDLMLNAKYLLHAETSSLPALAVGTMDMGKGGSPSYYVAASKDLGPARLHAGAVGDSHHSDPMLGLEFAVTDNAYLLADWIDGDENYLTTGIYLEIGGGTAINCAVGFPNADDGSDLFLLNISRSWSLF